MGILITEDVMKNCFTNIKDETIKEYILPLRESVERLNLNTVEKFAMFCAQIGHESVDLTAVEENFNYSNEGLLKVFPKYFTPATAEKYGRTKAHPANKQMIANIAYANRMGNGDPSSGDGWNYRGRSPIHLTGLDNYRLCGRDIGVDLVNEPDMLFIPQYGMVATCWFWTKNKLNDYCVDINAATRKINGGTNGLSDRTERYNQCLSYLQSIDWG